MNMVFRICSILLTFFIFSGMQNVGAQRYRDVVSDDVRVQYDLEYGEAETYLGTKKTLQFDFYEPYNDSLRFRPLIITVFGGSFIVGNRSWVDMQAWGDSLARRGYVVASIDYRLGYNPASEKSLIRAAYRAGQDVSAAVSFFKKEYAAYGVDTNRIFLLGNSAGSIASLIAAFLQDDERPPETYGDKVRPNLNSLNRDVNSNQSAAVAGVVSLWGGLTDMNFIDASDNVPVCFIHGQDDKTVPYDVGPAYNINLLPLIYGSSYLASRMDSLGIYNELHLFPDKGHCFYLKANMFLEPDEFNTCLSIVVTYFDRLINEGEAHQEDGFVPGHFSKQLSPLSSSIQMVAVDSGMPDSGAMCKIMAPDGRVLATSQSYVQRGFDLYDIESGIYLLQTISKNKSRINLIELE
jgi:acetyl esterase/lipase